jgi:hypothetical protein
MFIVHVILATAWDSFLSADNGGSGQVIRTFAEDPVNESQIKQVALKD